MLFWDNSLVDEFLLQEVIAKKILSTVPKRVKYFFIIKKLVFKDFNSYQRPLIFGSKTKGGGGGNSYTTNWYFFSENISASL
mgnify:CR=1 FL=1